MKKGILKIIAGAAAFIATPLAAQQINLSEEQGTYVFGGGGISWVESYDFTLFNIDLDSLEGIDSSVFDHNGAAAFRGGVGYSLGNGFSVEVEYAFRSNKEEGLEIPGTSLSAGLLSNLLDAFVRLPNNFDINQVALVGIEEKFNTHALMVNLQSDVVVQEGFSLSFGAGLGYLFLDEELDVRLIDQNGTVVSLTEEDDAGRLAGQLSVGAYFAVTESLKVGLSYRYLASFSDFKLDSALNVGRNYSSQNLFLEMRYTLPR